MLREAPSEGEGLIIMMLTLNFARLCIIALQSFVATNMLHLNACLHSRQNFVLGIEHLPPLVHRRLKKAAAIHSLPRGGRDSGSLHLRVRVRGEVGCRKGYEGGPEKHRMVSSSGE